MQKFDRAIADLTQCFTILPHILAPFDQVHTGEALPTRIIKEGRWRVKVPECTTAPTDWSKKASATPRFIIDGIRFGLFELLQKNYRIIATQQPVRETLNVVFIDGYEPVKEGIHKGDRYAHPPDTTPIIARIYNTKALRDYPKKVDILAELVQVTLAAIENNL